LLDEFLIQVHPIGQDHVPKGAFVLIVAVGLDRDFFPEGEVSDGVFGIVSKGLALLRAVDAAEANCLRIQWRLLRHSVEPR
jgi:hypothetical protein